MRSTATLSLRTIGDPRFAGPLPTDRYLIPGTRTEYGDGHVATMTSPGLESFKALLQGASERKHQITADISRTRWRLGFALATQTLGWITLASAAVPPLRKAAKRSVELRRTEMTTLRANLETTPISVNFDMDSEVGAPHRRMQSAFDMIAGSQRVWSIESSQGIDRVKARSYAGVVIGRKPTSLGRTAHSLINTEDVPPSCSVQGGRSTAYFYPGFVLVSARDGSDFALVDLVDLDISSAQSHFTETEGVPSDAISVGTTWAKANKNGSRDKRFADNRQLPIMLYGELRLSSSGGLNEVIMASRSKPCDAFVAAVQELSQILSTAKRTNKIGGRRFIPDRR